MNRLLVSLGIFMSAVLPLAGAEAPIRYIVRFPEPQTHYAEVEASFPAGKPTLDVMMAVWTPGSYLVREYARNLENVTAKTPDGRPLTIEKTTKNRWRISSANAPTVVVSYRVYSREMSVRTNWVEDRFALLNGAPTFLTLPDGQRRPHIVRLELPTAWKTSISGLPNEEGQPNRFVAKDFDTLVDSPILAGNPAIYEFDVEGKKHYLVNEGEGGMWDGPRSAADVEKIVREYRRQWGFLPYDKYVFFNILSESGGGLEHANSTVLMGSRFATRTRAAYYGDSQANPPRGGWLGLVSHEYFHLWNVKRLRPVELGPFQYENEVYTKSLWVSEGFTDYYGSLALVRASLIGRDEYLGSLSRLIESVQSSPGRLVQSAAMSSFDAWIKYYRPDENSDNTGVSYYSKGAVIGFLLDARIRKATNGAKGLDDLMKSAFDRFSGAKGFTQEEFRRTASEVAGVDLTDWFHRTVDSTEELDYNEAMQWYGLRFRAPEANNRRGEKAWLGVRTKSDNGRLIVTRVTRDTPGYTAGLNVDDEILAFNDTRVRTDTLDRRLDEFHPGEQVEVLVSRREQLRRIPVTLGKEPSRSYRVEVDPGATDEQKAHLQSWLRINL